MNTLLLTVLYVIGVACAEFNATIDGYIYYISYPRKLDWFQSFRYCRHINMHLIDLTTAVEINRTGEVVNFFKIRNPEIEISNQLSNFWTSGCDHGEGTDFYWMSNGYSFGVTNWDHAQPDNLFRLEHCVEMQHKYPFRWNDEFCSYKKNFICRDRVILPTEQIHRMNEPRSTVVDGEKPVRVANASVGYTHVSLI